jgi:hypothetical protein
MVSSLVRKSTKYVPQDSSHTFASRSTVYDLLLWICRVIPFRAMFFRFWFEVEETAFITRHGGKQEIISLGNMSLKQLLR